MKKYPFVILSLLTCTLLHGQDRMTLEEAVSIALKNNFDIQIAHNDAEIARLNNTAGNAGMLPSVSATATRSYAQNNIDQKLSNGNEIKSPDSRTNSFNGGVALNWTLFDGGKMFITKNKLSEIEALGQVQFRDKVMQTVYNVIISYYNVVKQKQELVSIGEVITYNEDRVKISQTSFDAGLVPKTTLLQAKIDLNVFKEEAVSQQQVIIEAKRMLNRLLGRDIASGFDVSDSIPLGYTPDKQRLTQKLDSVNTSILMAQAEVEIARLTVKENNTLLFPRVSVSAGYNLVQSNNTAGNILKNNSYGPTAGLTLSIPLFQSGYAIRQIRTSRLSLQSSSLALESARLQTYEQLQNALTDYENQLSMLQIEKENDVLAKENLDISLQRLRLGVATSLEARQAQESYVDARTRRINLEYNLKLAETKLKQLISEL